MRNPLTKPVIWLPANPVRAGDAAVTLLKAGADSTKRDRDGLLAIDLAPDREVGLQL